MPRHLTRDELDAGLPHILAAPKDNGLLEAIVIRPRPGERLDVQAARVSSAHGVEGDHWANGCWRSLPDGSPDPDVQVCIMNARCIALIAQERANWAAAGDNLFVDMDLSPQNLPPGARLRLGTAAIEITAVPHNGCASFIERYGRDACVFVNGPGRPHRLRGVYARVVRDGVVRVGDVMTKAG
jgi:MOSC domain-containing protein YiiM